MNFYSTTLFIFLILLILILAYIAYTLAFPDDVQYPPIVANCPDYWVNSKSQNGDPQCELPIELQSEYKLLTGKKTFSSFPISEVQTDCDKLKWIKNNSGFTWDGISNANLDCNTN